MTDHSTFKTEIFTTSPGVYLRCLLGMWFRHYGIWIVIPLVISIILGCAFDLRWIIVTLMLIFIVIPMLLTYLYFYYMLTPEARRAVLAKSVELHTNGSLSIDYENSNRENLPADEIAKIVKWSNYIAIVLKREHLSFILVPQSLISDSLNRIE